MHQMLCTLGINAVEVLRIQTFGDTCGMHDVVELQSCQLLGHLCL